MTDLSVDLEWWRDSRGYRIKDPAKTPSPKRTPPQKASRMTGLLGSHTDDESGQSATADELLMALSPVRPTAVDTDLLKAVKEGMEAFEKFERRFGQERRIVPLGGDRIPYRPLSEFGDILYLEFAKSARDAAGALRFVQRFGPLTKAGLDPEQGDSVALVVAMAETMYGWLVASSEGDAKNIIGPQGLSLGDLRATLIIDQMTSKPKVRFTVDSLMTGLWIQLGQALAGGAQFRECRYCGTLFEAGPGTGRRFDSSFCCDQHRITYHSHKRSKAPAYA